jgi:hypothetical protein
MSGILTEWKRGAVFVSEIVPKSMIALIANKLYREHYYAMPMRHSILPATDTTNYLYEWKSNGKWNKLGGDVSNTFAQITTGSPEEFIFEHYWGYNSWNETVTMEYQVEHISWEVAQVTKPVFEADITGLYGKEFVPHLGVKPYSAFFAKGSDIGVRMGAKLRKKPTFV